MNPKDPPPGGNGSDQPRPRGAYPVAPTRRISAGPLAPSTVGSSTVGSSAVGSQAAGARSGGARSGQPLLSGSKRLQGPGTGGQEVAGQQARSAYGWAPTTGAALRRPQAGSSSQAGLGPLASANASGRSPTPGSALRGRGQADAGSRFASGSQMRAVSESVRAAPVEPAKSANPVAITGGELVTTGRRAIGGGPSTSLGMPANQGSRIIIEAGDPYPPLAGRQSDGSDAFPMDQKRVAPRSPRAALEPEQLTLATKRSKRARNPLVIVGNAIFSLLILTAVVGGVAVAFGKHRFEAPGPLEKEKMVNIPSRLGTLDIAELLRREGVIDEHWTVFAGGVVALKALKELKSGEYLFPKRASVRDVVETMVEGKVVQHPITIPEGLTSEQVVRRLLDNDMLTGNIKDIPQEGSLLPESYRFPRGIPRDQVIQRMQRDQRRIVQESWERRSPDVPLRSPEQLVILASIVERETSKPEERTRVAAVFVNRLKQKKRLESDPTIIYGLVGGKGPLGHPITKSEKETPTPYNTYMIDGLPPGPIGNPGRASIEAVANPARTKEMFFVADGTGGHVFSETYDQHLRHVARLRALEAGERSASAAVVPGDSETSGRSSGPALPRQNPAPKRPPAKKQ